MSNGGAKYREFVRNERIDAKIVSLGEDGELIYSDYDGKGGRLLDFSCAGYKNGNEPIPNVKVVKTIEAGELCDHTALIKDAIDEVAALPLEERGAILLRAGTYTISETLYVSASGIVLRGEGQGENGTVIYDSRATRELSSLEIRGEGTYIALEGTKRALADDFTPAGAVAIKLTDVNGYNVGDSVAFTCAPNDLWVQTLGMDVIPGENAIQWAPSEYVVSYERRITDIDRSNGAITIDTGIPLTFDNKYYSVTVEKIEDFGRISECGIENIRFVSYYNGSPVDEEHARSAVSLVKCRNCWVREVSAKHYSFATVSIAYGSINTTVERCSYLAPISKLFGGRRYSFCMSGGQYALVKNCYSYEARHDYAFGAKVCGPNVFLDSVAENGNAACEPHHRWTTGALYDNICLIGREKLGYIQLINRGRFGSGHGWACANSVMWNCLAPALNVGKPQTEQNFAVGVYGIYDIDKEPYLNGYRKFVTPRIETPNYPETVEFSDSPMHGNGYIEAPHNSVNPSSLYKAQLSYRLYGDARKNVIPNAPILEYPAADCKTKNSAVAFGGVCDMNADKVYIWVDGEKSEATIANDGSCKYSLELNLENGYHEICVTQVIDGIESERNAARIILVGQN